MSQIEMVDLDSLFTSMHTYRRFQAYLPETSQALAEVSQLKGADGYGAERVFRCMLLQFMEDFSDRELERYLKENLAAKWFCGFTLSEPTLDYSLFTRIHTRMGQTRLSQLFATMCAQLKAAGLISEVISFVDATHLIAKATLSGKNAIRRGNRKLRSAIRMCCRKRRLIRKLVLGARTRRRIGTCKRNMSVWICSHV